MTIKEQRRRAKANIAQWDKSTAYELGDVYGRYSNRKRKAWNHCRSLCRAYDGRCLKVISHNTNIFTAGFEFTCPSTGVCMFMYITPTYETIVEMKGE